MNFEDFIAFICACLFLIFFFDYAEKKDLEKNENICYKFKSQEGVVYQTSYKNCRSKGSNFICEIDNHFFQVFEYEKIFCEWGDEECLK